jgi:hypothetical protein
LYIGIEVLAIDRLVDGGVEVERVLHDGALRALIATGGKDGFGDAKSDGHSGQNDAE